MGRVNLFALLAATLLMAGGCVAMHSVSGGYAEPQVYDNPTLCPPLAFTPTGLEPTTQPIARPPLQRLAVAEFGERDFPDRVADSLRKARGGKRRKVIVLPSTPMVQPPTTLHREAFLLAAAIIANANVQAETQPSTQPTLHIAATSRANVTTEDFDRIEREARQQYLIDLKRQSTAELDRLKKAAADAGADSLMVFTEHEWVDANQLTPFDLLDVLILPIFILPTNYYQGKIDARAWLIDVRSGQVVDRADLHDWTFRLTPLYFEEVNRRQAFAQLHDSALDDVAGMLLRRR